jgi:acyl-CoA synthetase (AMP-forming)/AMP-acid ligase II/acyl carrier protein
LSVDTDTLGGFLADLAYRYPKRPALIDTRGSEATYEDLRQQVNGVVATLLDPSPNDRIAIVMPNGPDMSVALLAVMSACVAVPLNPAYTEAELEAYFAQARVKSLLVGNDRSRSARSVAEKLGIPVIQFGVAHAARAIVTPPRPDDIAIILLTSGTTGRSKLVPLTHRNLTVGARNVAGSMGLSPDDRVLSMWEQYHVGGVVDLLLAPLYAGGSIISAGGFNVDLALELLGRLRPTWFQGVPTTVRALYHRARELGPDWHDTSLRLLRSVAAALPPEWMRDLEDYFGVPVIQTFGMTEAAPLITSTRLPPAVRKPNSTGLPCGTTIAIIDEAGTELPNGATGEVAVRGANVFSGYLDDPEANAAAFRRGWFLTGDLGFIDPDGELFLAGRTKDLINRGGEKISPREVEEAVLAHPSIEQAAVFAVNHPTLGEDIGAALVLRRGKIATTADVEAFVAGRLAPFKVPHRFLLVTDLPKSGVGKVLRSEVAAIYAEHLKQAHRTAPANGLEEALAKTWADELDVESVGVEDTFVELGGDSLSSVRILMAAEGLLGLTMPEDAARHFTTVRAMAAYLVEMGCATEPPFLGKAGDVDQALLQATAKLQGHPLDQKMLARARSRFEFQAARHAAENVATPAELETMLSQSWLSAPAALRHPVQTLQAVTERWRVGGLLREAKRQAAHPGEWCREPLGVNADLFRSHTHAESEKTLVVGFSSRAMRLTAPTYAILCALDPHAVDLLLLRDPTRQHYLSGVPGIGATIEATARWADAFAAAKSYARVVALGTSSGGIPAICAALLSGWPRVLAAGADQPSRHLHLQQLLATCAPLLPDGSTDIVLAYSALRQRDALGAVEINALLPSARQLPDHRFREHALLYLLQERGELGSFLKTNLVG